MSRRLVLGLSDNVGEIENLARGLKMATRGRLEEDDDEMRAIDQIATVLLTRIETLSDRMAELRRAYLVEREAA